VNIFLSWSGDHSRHVAQTLREYVPLVVQSATCFFSKNDIEAGTQWMTEIFDKLDARSIGLICITKDNQDRPWINFEAGALAFRLGKPRVVPILIDLEAAELKAPLGSFQTVPCDRDGLFAMFETINNQAEPSLSQDNLRRGFERWWPEIEGALDKFQASPPSEPRRRGQGEILDEILLGVRELLRNREHRASRMLLRVRPAMPLEDLWPKLLAEVHAKRPLILPWLKPAIPFDAENGVLRLAFPEENKLAMESLMQTDNRKFIEAIVSDALGAPYRLRCETAPI
jgi:hypothetical protein